MKGYVGYLLSEKSKELLKEIFPPKFQKFIGHHITTGFNVGMEEVPNKPNFAKVLGYVSDDSLEALVVQIDWRLRRKDGVYFHITWSLTPELRKPKDSKEIVDKWEFVKPIPIEIEPKFFPFKEQTK